MKKNVLGHGLGQGRGVKMDSKNHNWMIIEEYLALPFSYMTFVIKSFIEKNNKCNNHKKNSKCDYCDDNNNMQVTFFFVSTTTHKCIY